MKYGIVIPYPGAEDTVAFAKMAEDCGWDGFFAWESLWGIDAWVCLGAAAAQTKKIMLGTMLSPISRMRPWKVASEYITLDQLSGGRGILAVGLGAIDTGFSNFGEETDIRIRAELMDESLAIITGLFKGQPFEFKGRHYKVEPTDFFPPPSPLKQTIWVVALKGSRKSMSRAVSYQGLLPSVRNDDGEWRPLDPNDIGELRDYASRQGRGTDFDIVVEGTTPGDKPDEAKSEIERWKEAGATWWIESQWQIQNEANRRELFEERVRQGPPS